MSRPPQVSNKARPAVRSWPVFPSLSGYAAKNLSRDLAAGLTLAAIAIPEQMATARLGGFPPEIGFFAFIAGAIGFAVFGANRFLSVGADSTITPIFAGGLVTLAAAGTPEYAGMAAALALVVGVILIGGGLFRLGWIADLLSGSRHDRVSRRYRRCTSSSRSFPALLGVSPSPAAICCTASPSLPAQIDRANPLFRSRSASPSSA